ncbi:hypothetical protein [Streptomyces sp. NPDC006333]|uniref:hypothetical protein n=1 Tax=Streptomyces sp. NPDC006333 TaxID=3156753 RepID=UPI0033AD9BA1
MRPELNPGLRWGYVTTNVAALAEGPSQPKPNPDPPAPEEAVLVLNTAWQRDLDWGTFLFMTMVTGSRRGEMCALHWADINLDRLELVVKHSNDGRRIKDTKTHQRRKQAIDVITRSVLAATEPAPGSAARLSAVNSPATPSFSSGKPTAPPG